MIGQRPTAARSAPRSSSTRSAGGGCSAATATSRRTRRSRAGLEVHPGGRAEELEIWIDRSIVPAGYGWSFPADDEVRVGRRLVRPALPRQGADGRPRASGCSATRSATRATGSRTGCGPPIEGDVFFAGDSAGHCLPLTAEGIRTAFYFGIACGRELRQVIEGARHARDALRRYARFSAEHEWKFRWMLRAQRAGAARAAARCWRWRSARWRAERFTHWAFDHYLEIAPPGASPRRRPRSAPRADSCIAA